MRSGRKNGSKPVYGPVGLSLGNHTPIYNVFSTNEVCMEILLILLSLGLLMYLAFRGFSVILLAPVCALLAAMISGLPLLPTFTELFMTKSAGYFKSFLPIFLLGALFGKIMGDAGLTNSIARAIIRAVGKNNVIYAIGAAGLILTYGGVSLFVVAFALYPFGASLFKQADIPKRLLPGCISVGIFGTSMVLPGSPQIQNVIPSVFFNTDSFAAPGIGFVSAILCLALGFGWVRWRCMQAATAGEGYGMHTVNEIFDDDTQKDSVPWWVAILPMVLVLVLNYICTKGIQWDDTMLDPFKAMNLPLIAKSVGSVRSSWSLIIALSGGIILTIIIGWRNFGGLDGIIKSLNTATAGAMTAILNTALLVGYGSVVAALAGFKSISAVLMGIRIGDSPLLSEFVTISLLAGLTGSASGGMSIALQTMGQEWLTWANNVGMSPDILHRVAAWASGGLSSMPHNGAVVTLIVLCGMTHKESYYDIFILCFAKLIAGLFAIMLYGMFGLF